MKFVDIDLDHYPVRDVYKLMIDGIVPRPIALVSTVSSSGVGNLAPFSYFNGVSSQPPCLMISVASQPDGSPKDTYQNIMDTREFVVNSFNEWITDKAHQTSANYETSIDELNQVGLTAMESKKVKPVRVAESALQFECRLHQSMRIGDGQAGSTTVFIGRVVAVHVWEKAFKDGHILAEELKPISRLGGPYYGKPPVTFELPRPKV